MPKIRKVRKPGRGKAGSRSVVDRIAPLDQSDIRMSLNIYGETGTGKTSLACTWPKPLLLIGAEDGSRSVCDVEGVEFVELSDAEDFSRVVEYLPGSKYRTAVLDTLGSFYDLELARILGIEELPATKDWGMASRDQWQQCNTKVITRVRNFLVLHKTQCHTLVLAQERVSEPEEEYRGILRPFVASACTPGVVKWLNGACNYISQTFVRQKTVVTKKKVGGKLVTKFKKVDGIEYCLRTAPDPVYKAKFRVPRGTPLPDAIVDPTFEKIEALIKGRQGCPSE